MIKTESGLDTLLQHLNCCTECNEFGLCRNGFNYFSLAYQEHLKSQDTICFIPKEVLERPIVKMFIRRFYDNRKTPRNVSR